MPGRRLNPLRTDVIPFPSLLCRFTQTSLPVFSLLRVPDVAMTVAQKPGLLDRLPSGCRLSILWGAIGCFTTLVINLSVIAWAVTLPTPDNDGADTGLRILFEGSCEKSELLNKVLHLLINILSSSIMAASNYGIQCLSAPTRRQVDEAHSRQQSLDIGVVSFRNMRRLPRIKMVLWWVLMLSSAPVHLL